MDYAAIHLTDDDRARLRDKFLQTPEVIPLSRDPKFFSLIVALGIHQEVGTIHDEFSTFLYDGETGLPVARGDLRSELISYRGYTGVRIWSVSSRHLDPRVPGLRALFHPDFSFDSSGRLHQCVLFPEIITQIAALQGAELVSVRPWGINTVFGGFDPRIPYYQGNMWELVNVDAIRYARLLENRQIAFWGTHDLVSHIAGMRPETWQELQARGKKMREIFENYFQGVKNPAPYALVLPYALGMLLDDLAQPMNYHSESRLHVVKLLADAIQSRAIRPDANPYLLKYPPSIETLIQLARSNDLGRTRHEGEVILRQVIQELRQFSHPSSARLA